jgi:hypothetical protein
MGRSAEFARRLQRALHDQGGFGGTTHPEHGWHDAQGIVEEVSQRATMHERDIESEAQRRRWREFPC